MTRDREPDPAPRNRARGRTLADAVRARQGVLVGHRAGRNLAELAKEFGFSMRTAAEIIRLDSEGAPPQRRETAAKPSRPAPARRPRPKPTERELLGAVCLVADLGGAVPTPEAYTQWSADLGLPSLDVVCSTFGTWTEALRVAGIRESNL